MKFRSTHASQPLGFTLDGMRYDVPVGGTCEIPEQLAFAVKLIGLPLEPASDVPAERESPAGSQLEKPKAKTGKE